MLISDAYRAEQEHLHENENYGVASLHFAHLVGMVCNKLQVDDLLDYGAGKGRLKDALPKHLERPIKMRCYDPAVPKWSASPAPAEMVACIDVLEHIEPECLDDVLDDLKRCVLKAGVFTVHTGEAIKILSDGRNAHLIQQPPEWWLPKFIERFEIQTFQRMDNGFYIIAYAKWPSILTLD